MKKTLLLLFLLMTALVVNSQTNIVIADKYDRTPILIAELKAPITDFITRHYTGFIINQATRVVKNNTITFEIIIVQGTITDTLIYDQNYNITREIVQTDSIKPSEKTKK
jgi:ABC-type uncharacterized transport system fused permease/ATPase subunit